MAKRLSGLRLACGIATVIFPAAAVRSQTAAPATASDATSDDIVVTAQKRSENVQRVPIAITAIDGKSLDNSGVFRSRDLERVVPGLVSAVASGPINPYLRGVGINTTTPGQDAPVATYIDGVYIVAPFAATLMLNSVERVEVLRGPQGTLFGRNATAGVISYITRDPGPETRVDADVGYATYDTASAHLYASAPLSAKVRANVAIAYLNQHDGYGYNYTLRERLGTLRGFSARAKLALDLAPTTSVLLTGWYASGRSSQNVAVPNPGVPGLGGYVNVHGRYDSDAGFRSFNRNRNGGGSVKLEQELGDLRLVDIAAFQTVRAYNPVDGDLLPADLQNAQFSISDDTFTNELQLLSSDANSFRWMAGVYGLSGRTGFDQVVTGMLVPGGSTIHSHLRTTSIAPFAQGTLALAASTRLTLGARYSIERRRYFGTQGNMAGAVLLAEDVQRTFRSLTGRAALEHDFSPTILGYASYNRGFKAGTFNMGVISAPPRVLKPETLDAVELGLKSRLFDRALTANIAVFGYNYRNVTVRSQLPGTVVFDLQNAASARLYGVDADLLLRLSPRLRISAAGELLHARYRSFPITSSFIPQPAGGGYRSVIIDASGNRMVNAPRMSGNIGIDYVALEHARLGKVSATANLSYRSRTYFEADNIRNQPGYGILNLGLGWESANGKLNAHLWVNNVTETRFKVLQQGNSFNDFTIPGAPRTAGVTIGASL